MIRQCDGTVDNVLTKLSSQRGVVLNPPTTDPRTTDRLTKDYILTNPPTHRPQTHQPTDPILTDPTNKILFKKLDNRKISVLQNTNTAGKMLNFILRYITYFMSNICLCKFERLRIVGLNKAIQRSYLCLFFRFWT